MLQNLYLYTIFVILEPITNIQDVPPAEDENTYINFAQKMLQNFMNYVLSYSLSQQQMIRDPSATYVPLSAVQNWYTNFERRLINNPNFWKT